MNNILVIVSATSVRRWQAELLARLKACGYTVSTRHGSLSTPGSKWLDRVLATEGLRFGPSLAGHCEPLALIDLGPADLVIDLTNDPELRGPAILTLEFCGHSSFPAGVTEMLASGRSPELVTRLDGIAVGRARPMLGDRVWLSRASNDLLAGAISLIVQSVGRFFADRLTPVGETSVEPATNGGFLRHYLPFITKGFASRIARKLRLRRRPFYWQVAYRLIDEPGVADTGRLDGAAFTVLPDDGQRFYADPFVFEQGGRHYLFVEEFPYDTGRGIISVAELGDDGRFGVPRAVIEEPHHLSYPQVFAHAGEIFMIPESSAAGQVVLYRAEQFPGGWVRDSVLIRDRDFNDATLLETGGRFWLVGTERTGHGSRSDTMAVYSATSLRGPWEPHRLNPIAIDHSAARPGGAFIRNGENLILPVQDGSLAYGGGLGLMELVQIDADDVVFASPRAIGSGPAWDRSGIHTLNRAGRLEVVDSAG